MRKNTSFPTWRQSKADLSLAALVGTITYQTSQLVAIGNGEAVNDIISSHSNITLRPHIDQEEGAS